MLSSAGAKQAPNAGAAGSITIGGDLKVNRLGFGAMRVTGPEEWGEPADPAAMKRLLRRVVELGVNLIDTADAYGPEVSERLIAEALHPYPAGLIIATKGGIVRPTAPEWVADGRPEHLRATCEASLKRLRLERIDLYQLHATDERVPLADSVGELAKLRKEGKIRHIGVSNVSLAELKQAQAVVEIVSVQNRYNAAFRIDDEVLNYCASQRIAYIPWAPLAVKKRARREDEARIAALGEVAKARGATVAQVSLAWLLARSPAMLPIPGTSSIAHLEENVGAAHVKLTAKEIAAIG